MTNTSFDVEQATSTLSTSNQQKRTMTLLSLTLMLMSLTNNGRLVAGSVRPAAKVRRLSRGSAEKVEVVRSTGITCSRRATSTYTNTSTSACRVVPCHVFAATRIISTKRQGVGRVNVRYNERCAETAWCSCPRQCVFWQLR